MTTPDGLASQIFLLSYDAGKERLTIRPWLGYVLRAAVLADLRARGGAGERDKVVHPLGAMPAEPVLASMHQEIAQDRPRSWAALIRRNRRATEDAVIADLVAGGWIMVDRPRRWWSRPRFHITDPRVLTRMHERLGAVLRSAEPAKRVPAQDAALVALLAAGDVRIALPKTTIREYARRIDALTERAEPIPRALKRALNAAKSSAS